jgi:hypothetical protein
LISILPIFIGNIIHPKHNDNTKYVIIVLAFDVSSNDTPNTIKDVVNQYRKSNVIVAVMLFIF